MNSSEEKTSSSRSVNLRRKALVALFGLALVPTALLLGGSGGNGLVLAHEYFLPLHFVAGSEIQIDTPYCANPVLTAEGWMDGWLHTDSSGDIQLVAGIPPWSPSLDAFTFCGDPLLPWDEGTYKLDLTSYQEVSGGNRLKLVFDVPTLEDDLIVILVRGTPRFEVRFGDVVRKGVALPFEGKPFNWTVE